MTKYLSLTLFWALNAFCGFFVNSIASGGSESLSNISRTSLARTQAGRETDSIVELAVAPPSRFMTSDVMTEILKKRLTLFPKSQIPRLGNHIRSLCTKYQFDPALILGLIEVESGFQIKSNSGKGAVGLMQVMVPTASFVIQKLGLVKTGFEGFSNEALRKGALTSKMLSDPFLNISVGIGYLAWLRDCYKEKNSHYYMLAAYNIGPARMNQLMARRYFKPVETKRYFLNISQATLNFRFYGSI